MITLGLMQMTTLPQGITNSIVQFVQIVIQILALYLQDQAYFFLDNIRVKWPKTKYNNKEIALEIKLYIFEYI